MEPSPTPPLVPPPNERVFRWGLVGVAVFAMLVHAAALSLLANGLRDDPDGYRTMAVIIRSTGVIGRGSIEQLEPTAYRPPLYPLLLAGLVRDGELSVLPIAVLHFALSIATVLLSALLARRCGLPGPLALLTALLVTCDPLLLNQSARVMTEPTATFLATVALITLTQLGTERSLRWAIASGVSLGLAALCRPTFLPLFPLLIVAILTQPRRENGQSGWRLAAVFLLAGVTVLAPWTVRNYGLFGRPILATTHGGYTLLLGNNQGFYKHLNEHGWGEVWDARELDAVVQRKKDEGMDELQLDAWAYATAFTAIHAHPDHFVRACLIRIGRLWNVAPHKTDAQEGRNQRLLRRVVGGWYTLVFALAAVGAWRLRRALLSAPWVWGLAFCLCFTVVHTFYWSNLRMRAPLMPYVCMLAAASLVRRAGTSSEEAEGSCVDSACRTHM